MRRMRYCGAAKSCRMRVAALTVSEHDWEIGNMPADLLQDAQLITFLGLDGYGPFYRLASIEPVNRFAFVAAADAGGRVPRAVLAGFAHAAMEAACRTGTESPNVVSLNCDFVADAKSGDCIEAQVRMVRRTRSVIFLSADLTAGGRALLTANGLAKPAP